MKTIAFSYIFQNSVLSMDKFRAIKIKVDKQGYITIDEAIKAADRNFNDLISPRRKKK